MNTIKVTSTELQHFTKEDLQKITAPGNELSVTDLGVKIETNVLAFADWILDGDSDNQYFEKSTHQYDALPGERDPHEHLIESLVFWSLGLIAGHIHPDHTKFKVYNEATGEGLESTITCKLEPGSLLTLAHDIKVGNITQDLSITNFIFEK